ncbi:MAG TPA: hypothetical protein VKE98_14355 [Gemmataceae bacterium]|nr:hypothetical protein [Gemmataceae bacterium]
MPNDAKLGLMVGVGLVVVIGFVFFRKEPGSANQPEAAPAAVNAKETETPAPSNVSQSVPAKTLDATPAVPVSTPAPAPTAIPVSTTPPS